MLRDPADLTQLRAGVVAGRSGRDVGSHAGRFEHRRLVRRMFARSFAAFRAARLGALCTTHEELERWRLAVSMRPSFGLLLPLGAIGSNVSAASSTSQSERRIEAHLLAPCCYVQTQEAHQSPLATRLRAEIQARLMRDENEMRIESDLVARNGRRVRAVPPGFDVDKLGAWMCASTVLVSTAALAGAAGRYAGAGVESATPTSRRPTAAMICSRDSMTSSTRSTAEQPLRSASPNESLDIAVPGSRDGGMRNIFGRSPITFSWRKWPAAGRALPAVARSDPNPADEPERYAFPRFRVSTEPTRDGSISVPAPRMCESNCRIVATLARRRD